VENVLIVEQLVMLKLNVPKNPKTPNKINFSNLITKNIHIKIQNIFKLQLMMTIFMVHLFLEMRIEGLGNYIRNHKKNVLDVVKKDTGKKNVPILRI